MKSSETFTSTLQNQFDKDGGREIKNEDQEFYNEIMREDNLLGALRLLLLAYESDGTDDFQNIDVIQVANLAINKTLAYKKNSMITEENQKIKDGSCIDHKFSEPKFDCETKDGKTFPRWSIKCQRCGYKEYSSLLDVDYVAVPIVIFSERSFRI